MAKRRKKAGTDMQVDTLNRVIPMLEEHFTGAVLILPVIEGDEEGVCVVKIGSHSATAVGLLEQAYQQEFGVDSDDSAD